MNVKRLSIYVLILIIISLFLFVQVKNHKFIHFDDFPYIVNNENIKEGFSLDTFKWAFTTFEQANWHPITWLSHSLDYKIFSLNSGKHHLMNVFIHIINSILLFFLMILIMNFNFYDNKEKYIKWLTLDKKVLTLSFFIALIFSIHPMHVESVCWASERKDVLSTLFFILTIIFYLIYLKVDLKVKKKVFLIFSIIFYIIGLLSKPMIVTIPLVLILIDIWINRLIINKKFKLNILFDKIPYFLLSVSSSILTIIAQKYGGAVRTIDEFAFVERINNSFLNYYEYLIKFFFPLKLSIFYPYVSYEIFKLTICVLLILFFTFVASLNIKRKKYIFVGWFFYIVTLIPVIGLIQVGYQSIALRYTYIPYIGLSIIVSFFLNDFLSNNKLNKFILILSKLIIILWFVFLLFKSYGYIKKWKDSYSIFTHALNVTKNNFMANNNLGAYYFYNKNYDMAIKHFDKAIKIKKDNERAYSNLSEVYFKLNNIEKVKYYLKKAIEINPDFYRYYNNLGMVLFKQKKYKESLKAFEITIEKKADFALAHYHIIILSSYLNDKLKVKKHKNILQKISPELYSKL